MKKNVFAGSKNHPGTQPVRVLQHNIASRFYNLHPKSIPPEKLVSEYKINPGINVTIGELPMFYDEENHTPFITQDNSIYLGETFLSYLWILSYAHYKYFNETIRKPSAKNEIFDVNNVPKDIMKDFETACKMFDYAMNLKKNYTQWNPDWPNPECYDQDIEEDIIKTNGIFTAAISAILFHELGHAVHGHTDRKTTKEDELEADVFCFNTIKEKIDETGDILNLSAGVLVGYGALYLLNQSVNSNTHPDSDYRIQKFFEIVDVGINNELKALSCYTFQLGNLHYRREIVIPDSIENYDQLFEFFMNPD